MAVATFSPAAIAVSAGKCFARNASPVPSAAACASSFPISTRIPANAACSAKMKTSAPSFTRYSPPANTSIFTIAISASCSQHRAWPLQQATLSEYRDTFISGATHLGKQWLYFAGEKLVGIGTMDEAPGAISLVYFVHDPAWRPQSPGRFSVLNQLLYAKQRNLRYAYLGYWIKNCPSMNYKNRFHPHEILVQHPAETASPVWKAPE